MNVEFQMKSEVNVDGHNNSEIDDRKKSEENDEDQEKS